MSQYILYTEIKANFLTYKLYHGTPLLRNLPNLPKPLRIRLK